MSAPVTVVVMIGFMSLSKPPKLYDVNSIDVFDPMSLLEMSS